MKGKRKCFVGEFACNNYMGEVSLNVFIYIISLLLLLYAQPTG